MQKPSSTKWKTTNASRVVKPRRTTARTKAKKSRNSHVILLIGASKCGKSSFLKRLLFDLFSHQYTPTTEDYYQKTFEHRNFIFHFDFIDTCGPFEFPAMRDLSILRADVALLMYDVSCYARLLRINVVFLYRSCTLLIRKLLL